MSLFGTSGVRGIVNEDLTPEMCQGIARALGTSLPSGSRVCLSTDTRVSGEMLKQVIVSGLLASSVNVTDLGILPTPALAMLTRELGFDSGVMITASHNPPEFNGMKLFSKSSLGYSRTQEQEIENIYFERRFRNGRQGTLTQGPEMKQRYTQFIQGWFSTVKPDNGFKTVIDPGNGAASGFVSHLFTSMGLKVAAINDEPDGLFPGRNPEPREDTLQGTIQFLRDQKADLAICFDGDADRVVFCDREGFLGFNEMISFISRLIIKGGGKKRIATTVETGWMLDLAVKDLGVEVVRGKVGDVNVAYLAQELDAAIGVEQVGVYIMPQAGYYPDSIFAALTLISQIRGTDEIRAFLQKMPRLFFDKRKISCPNQFKDTVMEEIKRKACYWGADHINLLDGVRLEFKDSWILIRASGTEPAIRVIAESMSRTRTEELLDKGIQAVHSSLERTAQRR